MEKHKRHGDTIKKKWSFSKHIKNNFYRYLLFVLILLFIAIIQAAIPLGHNIINNEENSLFITPWQYSLNEESYSVLTLPNSKNVSAGEGITLKNHLPLQMIKGATVLLRTSQQDVIVYVNEELVYSSYDKESNIPAPSSAYHFVRMPIDCAGKEITITLTSPYENYAGLMNQIYIGSKASNVFFLFRENGLRFIVGFLIFSLGLLIVVMFSVTKSHEGKITIICLGAFSVCAGYWVMVESKMMQFLFPYPVALTNSSIFALTLLPVFAGFYYYSVHTKFFKKAEKCVVIIVALASLFFSIASWINPEIPLFILPIYIVFMGLFLVAIFVSIFVESIKAGNHFSTSILGIITFTICCLIELVIYLANMKNYNNSTFFTVGLLLFCTAMVIDSVQKFAKVYQSAIKVDALSVLAYMDGLTGLKNRTAFLESMSNVNVDSQTSISMAMFDINNLKEVNDTLGHLVGDALLRHSAKLIKSSLRVEDELYRIGGDEFAAIIRHSSNTIDLGALEDRIVNIVENENLKPLSYRLSIAYGYATFSSETDKTLFETLSRADEIMYARKKMQKSAINLKEEPGVKK